MNQMTTEARVDPAGLTTDAEAGLRQVEQRKRDCHRETTEG